MSMSSIDWLNQWLPIAKWLTVAALLFLIPLLLEACNRLRWKSMWLSASQRHDVWGITLIVWALSPILYIKEVTWSIPMMPAVPATDASRSVSDLNLPFNRIPTASSGVISSELALGESDAKTSELVPPAAFGTNPLRERLESKVPQGVSSFWTSLGWRQAWLALCAGGTFLLLIRLVRAQVVSTALVRSAKLVCEEKWVEDLMNRCSISKEIRLGVCEYTSIPILIGWLRPIILLPREAQFWPTSKLESVLLHEHAHIQRSDILWLRVLNIICAVCWVQPWVWIAARRMRCLREEACDDMVIGFGKDRREYSEHLIQIAERATYPVINVAGLGIAHSTSLGDRIIGILDQRRSRTRSSRRFQSMVCVALIILFGAVLLGVPNKAVGIAMPITIESTAEIQGNGSLEEAEAIQSSSTMTLSGTVVDSDDKPVVNCMVWGRGWSESLKEEFRQTRTDHQGVFSLTLPRSSIASDMDRRNHIMAYHENSVVSISSLQSNSASGIRLKLEPCRTISLEVKNSEGEPISEAHLKFAVSDSGRSFYAVERDFQFILNRMPLSDQNGRLDVIVPSWCLTPRIIVSHPDYCDVEFEFRRDLKIVMDRGTEIAIQLRTSIPDLRLEDSMLQIRGDNTLLHPAFDSSGLTRVRLKEFPNSLSLEHPRLGTKPGQVIVARQNVYGPKAMIEMDIKPLTTVSGKLVDRDSGLPAVGCHVFLKDSDDSNYWHRWGGAITNDLGEFKIECSSASRGKILISSNQDYELSDKPEILVNRPGEEGVVLPNILVQHRKRIGIRVVDDVGSPVEGALIAYGDSSQQFARTGQDGRANLVPRAEFELLRILHPTQKLAYFDSWTPIADEEETIVLQPETEITGRLVDLEGTPIPSVPVSFHIDAISEKNNTMNSFYYAAITDDDGTYRMRGISKQIRRFMAVRPAVKVLDLQVPWKPNMLSNSLSDIKWDRKLLEQMRTDSAKPAQDDFSCQEWWNGPISLRDHVNRTVIVREFSNLRDWDDHYLIELERVREVYQGKDVTCVVLISSEVPRKQIEQTIQRLKLGYSVGHLSAEASSIFRRDYAPQPRILRPTEKNLNRCVVPSAHEPLPLSIRNAILYSDER